MHTDAQRMINEQLRPRGINDERVLQAMLVVPRHEFVSTALQADAYADHALPIDAGQTISQPYVVALMTQALEVAPDARVLEVGTGSGYQAAILSCLAAHVYSVERQPILAQQAIERFARLGFENISVQVGDGTVGWPEHAPYDRAILTAAGPSVPQAIVAQLRRGGVLVLPIGSRKAQRLFRLRIRWLGYSREDLGRVAFVPLVGRYGWQEDNQD